MQVRSHCSQGVKSCAGKTKLTKELEQVGLWSNRAEVEDGLEQLVGNTKKVKALKVQINFRNKVLGQTHANKDVFKFSQNRKQYSMNQLKINLLTLVEAMHGGDSSDNQTITAQAQGVSSPQPECRPTLARCERSTLEEILKNPALLVGKKIRHQFEVGEELLWFIGTVLSVDLEKKEFQVVYEHFWMILSVVTWNFCDTTMYNVSELMSYRNSHIISQYLFFSPCIYLFLLLYNVIL